MHFRHFMWRRATFNAPWTRIRISQTIRPCRSRRQGKDGNGATQEHVDLSGNGAFLRARLQVERPKLGDVGVRLYEA